MITNIIKFIKAKTFIFVSDLRSSLNPVKDHPAELNKPPNKSKLNKRNEIIKLKKVISCQTYMPVRGKS